MTIAADIDPLNICPFCAHSGCKVIEIDNRRITQGNVYVKCDWCEAQGPLSRDAHRAVGSWNYVSRAVKKDRGVS